MDRLTSKRCSGIKTGYWSPANKEAVVQRLGAFEDVGLEPEEIRRLLADHAEAIGALTRSRDCEYCAHQRPIEDEACDEADFDCHQCKAQGCVCRDCEDGSRWEWMGGIGHEIP